MPSHRSHVVYICLIAAARFSGCADRVTPDYSISLRVHYPDYGYSQIFDITPDSLRESIDDHNGWPPSAGLGWKLTPEQQQAFARFAEALPLDSLKDRYEEPGVDDGFQHTYRLRIGDRPAREIQVNNVPQPSLDPLNDLINAIVPEHYREASASIARPDSGRAEYCASVRPDFLVSVIEGVGIGDNIVVGRSTRSDVLAAYGEMHELINHNKYSYQMRYSDLGVSFYYCQADVEKTNR